MRCEGSTGTELQCVSNKNTNKNLSGRSRKIASLQTMKGYFCTRRVQNSLVRTPRALLQTLHTASRTDGKVRSRDWTHNKRRWNINLLDIHTEQSQQSLRLPVSWPAVVALVFYSGSRAGWLHTRSSFASLRDSTIHCVYTRAPLVLPWNVPHILGVDTPEQRERERPAKIRSSQELFLYVELLYFETGPRASIQCTGRRSPVWNSVYVTRRKLFLL